MQYVMHQKCLFGCGGEATTEELGWGWGWGH